MFLKRRNPLKKVQVQDLCPQSGNFSAIMEIRLPVGYSPRWSNVLHVVVCIKKNLSDNFLTMNAWLVKKNLASNILFVTSH